MDKNDIVIVAAKRTPMGGMLGTLSQLSAPDLGAIAHQAAMEEINISISDIQEVISGCVLQAGIGQAPARQAALKAGIPTTVGATTINKMCGSGLKAVMLAHDMIKAGSANIVLASGMESMSNAPYLLKKGRAGYRLGHDKVYDHMFLDGLEDAYNPGQLMGVFAEQTAEKFNFTREMQDEFASRSMKRALEATEKGKFNAEMTHVTIKSSKGETKVDKDEGPDAAKLEKIGRLKPAFKENGTVTAANSSSISDGAASLILMRAIDAEKHGIQPLARIVAHSSHAQAPEWFTTAPIDAINKVLNRAGWRANDVDLYEINEAFAVVTMAAMMQLDLSADCVNIHGGACALGHPIGASGARILVTLLHALKQNQLKKGIASLCIGGGEAVAVAVEMV
ncbi:acetyl-CoA C-acyltransferase [Legionella sp. W05-934-2]|uniref:acetyl-CoA C-acyltransferase n=1 Tax=Legionella sp. W05-934-2 TaxID=1198649 RepID=UPI0034629943